MHLLELALADLQQGRYQEAAAICDQVLAQDPENDTAYNILGLIHHQAGNKEEAIAYTRRAVAAAPDNLARLCNLGCMLQAADRFAEAEATLRHALSLEPNFPEALYNLGLCLHRQGRIEEAASAYEQALALRPDYGEALYNLGVLYRAAGRLDLAENALQRCLSLEPDHAPTIKELGLTLYHSGRLPEAADYFQRLTTLTPQDAQAHYNLGVVLLETGRAEEAETALRTALALAPQWPEANNNMGIVLQALERYAEAEEYQRRAVQLDPGRATFWNDLGTVLQDQEKMTEAEAAYHRSLELAPDFAKTHYNFGNLFREGNRIDEAIFAYQKALIRAPDLAEAHWNLSHALLLIGRYEQGWREYEWRWRLPEHPAKPADLPEWRGEQLAPGAPLLVYCEQGMGDAIQFFRFLPLVRQRVAEVILACPPPLHSLFHASAPEGVRVVLEEQIPAVAAISACQASLLSLPYLLRITLNTLPAAVPYLRPDEVSGRRQADAVPRPEKGVLRVGVVWQGNPQNRRHYSKRCLPAELVLGRLAEVPGVRLFSLQKDREEPLPEGVTDLAPRLQSFADTAALAEQLDLVISIDTAAVHLAGALARPTWLLLPFVPPDWRWMLDRSDSPWYPTVRIWRQREPGDWHDVLHRVCQTLARAVHERELLLPPPGTERQEHQQPLPQSEKGAQRQWECLYLGLSAGQNFGWGVCSTYLAEELARRVPVHLLNEQDGSLSDAHLPGPLFAAIRGVDLEPLPQARGSRTYGYTFFENELPPIARENAKRYDLILAGSTWCRDRLQEAGIEHCAVLIQGIDPQRFFPARPDEERAADRPFTIFSGGKFELRKGQDLVLRAWKILQDKYPDMVLVTCWENVWPDTMRSMSLSPHITYTHRQGDWRQVMEQLYVDNGLDPQRIVTLGLQDNASLRRLYLDSDIGLFPNRCEGGTNLVLMEYMACGRPVIAANTSGHRDIVNAENAILLNELRPFNLTDGQGRLIARWEEADIEEIVAAVEYAYHHRQEIARLGQRAGEDLARFTWAASASQLLEHIL